MLFRSEMESQKLRGCPIDKLVNFLLQNKVDITTILNKAFEKKFISDGNKAQFIVNHFNNPLSQKILNNLTDMTFFRGDEKDLSALINLLIQNKYNLSSHLCVSYLEKLYDYGKHDYNEHDENHIMDKIGRAHV